MTALLVVCLGNICRSPLGEGALRAALRATGQQDHVHVDSAGTAGWHSGKPPDPRAQACALRHAVDIGQQRARQLQVEDFFRFDWLLCADRDNLAAARAMAPPGLENRAVLWLELAGLGQGMQLPDPYYGSDADFEQVWDLASAAARATCRRVAR